MSQCTECNVKNKKIKDLIKGLEWLLKVKIPDMEKEWHTKFRKDCLKFSDIRKKKPTKKKEKK